MADENRMRASHKVAFSFLGFMVSVSQFKTLKEVFLGDQEKAIARIESRVGSIDAKIDAYQTATTLNFRSDIAAAENRCEKIAGHLDYRLSNLESRICKRGKE